MNRTMTGWRKTIHLIAETQKPELVALKLRYLAQNERRIDIPLKQGRRRTRF
jgi:hypothetical protein